VNNQNSVDPALGIPPERVPRSPAVPTLRGGRTAEQALAARREHRQRFHLHREAALVGDETDTAM